jgi:hypothetical protein
VDMVGILPILLPIWMIVKIPNYFNYITTYQTTWIDSPKRKLKLSEQIYYRKKLID